MLSAALPALTACLAEPPTAPEPGGPAALIVAATPDTLTGTVAAVAAPTPEVEVRDIAGRPLRGVIVRFEPGPGSGEVGSASVVTNEAGRASSGQWTLGTRAGQQTLVARVGQNLRMVFIADARPSAVFHITVVSGGELYGFAETALPGKIRVRISDVHDNPVPDETVRFTPCGDCGSIDVPETRTDSEGIAVSGVWTLGSTVGVQQMTIASANREITATATAVVWRPCDATCAEYGWVAFVRDGQIYRVNSDGTGLLQLTSKGVNGPPAWSPDGRRLAFVSIRDGECCALYVMSADGSDVERRTSISREVAAGGTPTWSPDGTRIALSAISAGNYRIMVVPTEGAATVEAIGFHAGYNAHPSWSPDGKRIVFVSDWAAFDFTYDIYVMNADGANIQQLTHTQREDHFQPAWSPDGSRIALLRCPIEWDMCANSSVAVMNADGSDLRTLASATGHARPTWSPDGRRIAFVSKTCIVAIGTDGSDPRTIVCNAEFPTWARRPPETAPE